MPMPSIGLLGTFDPNSVQIMSTLDIASGTPEPMSGFATGTFINLARNGELFMNYVGSRGEVSRAINRDRTYTLTFTLQQTSEWNGKFFNLLNLEGADVLPDKIAVTAFKINSPGLADILIGQCWLVGMPDIVLSNEIEAYEWSFYCTNVAIIGAFDGATIGESL